MARSRTNRPIRTSRPTRTSRPSFNPFSLRGGLTPLSHHLLGAGVGPQNYLSSVALGNPHPFGGFLNAPAPILGLMAGGAAKIFSSALRNWKVKPEERFINDYHTLPANPFVRAPSMDGVPSLPRIAQLAQHTKSLGSVPFVDNHRAPNVQKNQAFVYKDKPYIMLDGSQSKTLGLGDKRRGVALNRYQNARTAASWKARTKAEENRGR